MAGFAEPRASEPQAMKDMLAELRHSRDGCTAQAEIRGSGNGSKRRSKGGASL